MGPLRPGVRMDRSWIVETCSRMRVEGTIGRRSLRRLTHVDPARRNQMPELLVDFITSLDGYGAAEGWPGFWGLEGPEYLAWLQDQPEEKYTILMGANTYRLMSGMAAAG